MSEYNNNNQGAIFRNDRKQKDTDPEYKGSVTVGGAEYWVSVWVNETKDGRKYFSHKYTPKNATQQHQANLQSQTTPEPKKLEEPNFNGGEDLPF